MPKKSKKPKTAKPFVLANNPDNNNKCSCFQGQVPSKKWVVINRFSTMKECNGFVDQCGNFFMMMPLSKMSGLRRMGMGMMR